MPVCTCNMYYHTYICRLSTVGTGRYMHKYVHKYTRILETGTTGTIYICMSFGSLVASFGTPDDHLPWALCRCYPSTRSTPPVSSCLENVLGRNMV